jgi:hypothetical protein
VAFGYGCGSDTAGFDRPTTHLGILDTMADRSVEQNEPRQNTSSSHPETSDVEHAVLNYLDELARTRKATVKGMQKLTRPPALAKVD